MTRPEIPVNELSKFDGLYSFDAAQLKEFDGVEKGVSIFKAGPSGARLYYNEDQILVFRPIVAGGHQRLFSLNKEGGLVETDLFVVATKNRLGGYYSIVREEFLDDYLKGIELGVGAIRDQIKEFLRSVFK